MRRLGGIPTVVAGIVFSLLSCSTMSGAATSTAKLKAEALTIHQMPKGWTASVPRGDPRLGCLTSLMEPKGVTETHKVQVFFYGRSAYSLFDETISTYSSAATAYKKIAASIASCRKLQGLLDGFPVTGTVSRLSVPHYGNASVAYSISLKGKTKTVKADYLIVRQGSVILGILEGGYPSVNLTQFRSLAAQAVSKAKK